MIRIFCAPSAKPREAAMPELKCSFCGKSQADVQALIAGPDVYICDDCACLCLQILLGRVNGAAKTVPFGAQEEQDNA